jgi:hypothetical protein
MTGRGRLVMVWSNSERPTMVCLIRIGEASAIYGA